MKIKKPKNLCLSCFGTLDFHHVCKSCNKPDDKTPSPPHHLQKRTVLNKKYVIARSLGEGGFGITYLAYDLVFSRPVCVKEYFPNGHVSRNPHSNDVVINTKDSSMQFNRGLKRFVEEARSLLSIKNLEGIVEVLDFFTTNDTAYIVMEYLDGVSLKRYVQKKGKLDVDTTLTILRPVITSLGAVHKAGLIHRDISPDNILITRNSEVKLIDFGASLHSGESEKSHSIVLKQGFAPEEQYRTHGNQGPWSDIYALGITIYYCVTGQLPPESIQRLYDDNLIPPSQNGVEIEKHREKALLKAIAVKAEDRYATVEEFEADIYGDAPKRERVNKKTENSEKKPRRRRESTTVPLFVENKNSEQKTETAQLSPRQRSTTEVVNTTKEERKTITLKRLSTKSKTEEKNETAVEEKKSSFINVEKTEKLDRGIKPIVTNTVLTREETVNGRQVKVRVIEHSANKPKKNLLSKIFKKQDN